MFTLRSVPVGKFFVLPQIEKNDNLYIKKLERGKEVVYRVIGANSKFGHEVHVKRVRKQGMPHKAANAVLMPTERFFKSLKVIYDD